MKNTVFKLSSKFRSSSRFKYHFALERQTALTLSTGGCFCILSVQESSLSLFITLASASLGILASKGWLKYLPFIPCALLSSAAACWGGFMALDWQGFPPALVGVGIAGFSAGWLAFMLPPEAVLSRFNTSFSRSPARLWSAAMIIAVMLRCFLRGHPYALSLTAFALMSVGILSAGNVWLYKSFAAVTTDRELRKKSLGVKCFILFACISASVAIALSAASAASHGKALAFLTLPAFRDLLLSGIPLRSFRDLSLSGAPFPAVLFVLGLVSGPAAASVFMEARGVFNASVLNVFTAEICALCFSFYGQSVIFPLLGYIFAGVSASFPLIICPALVYYLFGPERYMERLGDAFASLLFGHCAVYALFFFARPAFCPSPAIFAIFSLLLSSFFAIFSAWKHRLILLKTK